MKRLVILITAVICCCLLFAAPIYNMPLTLTQPDGTEFNCFASGDEYVNWIHDAEGYIIIQNPETGYYCYADTLKDGTLLISNKKVSIKSRGNIRTFNIEKYKQNNILTPSRTSIYDFDFIQAQSLMNGEQVTINNIVIFLRFSDQNEYSNSDIVTISTKFADSTENHISLKNYIYKSSFDKLKVNTNFYPQSTTILSYQDIHPRNYYLPYSAFNPTGYNDSERKQREDSLLVRAVNAVKTQIPSNINLDADNNNYVDNITFVVKGDCGAGSTLLWPHRWSMLQYCSINNKIVKSYNFQLSEYIKYYNVGVLCHEFCHTLGAPDLYHDLLNSNNELMNPVGNWDVMANTQTNPQQTSTYIKYKYLHWIDEIPRITHNGTYTLYPITTSTKNSYIIPIPNQTEFLLLEYRNKTHVYDTSIPNSGLLIYRINPDLTGNLNGKEAGGVEDEVYVYRYGGNINNDGNCDIASHYQGYGGLSFSDVSNPNDFFSDGTLGGVQISNFGTCGDSITFKVRFCGDHNFISTDVIYDSSNISSNNGAFNISTTGNITLTEDISFVAYESITLNPGFNVPYGIIFDANIITCE